VLAEVTAREIGRVTIAEALELTALVARKQPERYGRFAARWLCVYLEEHEKATLKDVALLVSNLQSLATRKNHAGQRKAARTSSEAPLNSTTPRFCFGKRAAALCPDSVFLRELGELLGEPERPHHVAGRRGNARCAHDRGNAGEDTLNLIGVDADVAGGADVKQVRGRWSVDRDERGDAHQHERLLIEGRGLDRVGGHRFEQVDNRCFGSRHDVPPCVVAPD
jgi:hypothetical protein